MIYTLNILTELIIKDLSGGSIPNDSPYSWEQVQAHVINAMREDLKLEMVQRRSGREDDRTPITQYIATFFGVAVQIEQSTFRAFIDLPSSYMSLKYNKGIHGISPMKKPNERFIPVANPDVTSRLPHADLERENQGFYAEGQKVYFLRDIKKEGVTEVLLKLIVPAPDTIGANDALPLLPENVARITDMVKSRVQNRSINDRLNDNNPNLRAQNG